MAWLIEAVLVEAKEKDKNLLHDHPYSAPMHARDDFYKKKREEIRKSGWEDKQTLDREKRQLATDKRDYYKYNDTKGINDSNKAIDVIDKHNKTAWDKGNYKVKGSDSAAAQDAIRRHNRKMERQGKPQLESIDLLVELM